MKLTFLLRFHGKHFPSRRFYIICASNTEDGLTVIISPSFRLFRGHFDLVENCDVKFRLTKANRLQFFITAS